VVGPPETPTDFVRFLNLQVNQEMDSAFFVFNLVGRNDGLKREGHARGFIHPEFDDGEEAVGLVVGEES
jgi:hypothetical protein